jgi:hypothetical protein
MGAGVSTGPHCLGGLNRAPKVADPPTERFRASSDPPPLPEGTCACALAPPVRKRASARAGSSFRKAAAPSSRPPSPRRRFPGETDPSARVWLEKLRRCRLRVSRRASAEAAAFTKPWLSPSCRCRGGFVSRPRLARSAPKGFPLRLWLGRRPSVSVRAASGHTRKLTGFPIRGKARGPVDYEDNGDGTGRARSG